MAKKAAKKPAKKAAKNTVKKSGNVPAKKPAPRATSSARKPSAARKTAPAAKPARASIDPYPVSTGSGASAMDIGQDLVAKFNAGQEAAARKAWHHADIESIEGHGTNLAWRGLAAIESKNQWWEGENEVLGASAEGPYLGSTGFAVKFRMDYRNRKTGVRTLMEEVAVYTVTNGKIVREEFMYGSSQPVSG